MTLTSAAGSRMTLFTFWNVKCCLLDRAWRTHWWKREASKRRKWVTKQIPRSTHANITNSREVQTFQTSVFSTVRFNTPPCAGIRAFFIITLTLRPSKLHTTEGAHHRRGTSLTHRSFLEELCAQLCGVTDFWALSTDWCASWTSILTPWTLADQTGWAWNTVGPCGGSWHCLWTQNIHVSQTTWTFELSNHNKSTYKYERVILSCECRFCDEAHNETKFFSFLGEKVHLAEPKTSLEQV